MSGRPAAPDVPGPLLFARYAYPPNELGYCGPDDSAALLEYAGAGTSDPGLAALARGFHGAWPYLALIAAAARREPLDPDVVEAYWIGNDLLHRVPGSMLAAQLTDRFAARVGPTWAEPAELAILGGRAHHNFHVFAVYPWVGLLRAGPAEEPLRVLDNCRVSGATVVRVDGEVASVRIRPLRYDHGRLGLGTAVTRQVRSSAGGHRLAGRLTAGDQVSVHWNWICDVLTAGQAATLRSYTARLLRLVNGALGRPAIAGALEPADRPAITG